MSQVTRYSLFLIAATALVVFIAGCPVLVPKSTLPGYDVHIEVDDRAGATLNELKILDDLATEERFGAKRVSSTKRGACATYFKEFSPEEFSHLKSHRGLSMVYCYDFESAGGGKRQSLKGLEVNINNAWIGQDPAVRKEIDRVADRFYDELSKRFGSAVRKKDFRTGPPF